MKIGRITIHPITLNKGENPFVVILMTDVTVTEHWATEETPELRDFMTKKMFLNLHRTTLESAELKTELEKPSWRKAALCGGQPPDNTTN